MPVVSCQWFVVLITINVCAMFLTVSMYRTGPTEVLWSIANQNRSNVLTSGSANWLVGATSTFTVWTYSAGHDTNSHQLSSIPSTPSPPTSAHSCPCSHLLFNKSSLSGSESNSKPLLMSEREKSVVRAGGGGEGCGACHQSRQEKKARWLWESRLFLQRWNLQRN